MLTNTSDLKCQVSCFASCGWMTSEREDDENDENDDDDEMLMMLMI